MPIDDISTPFSGKLYWLDIKSLKRDLRSATYFPAGSVFPYLLAMILMYAIGNFFQSLPKSSPVPMESYVISALGIVIPVWGTYHVYQMNGGAGGRDFLSRMLCLTWVWGWRYTLFMLIPGIIGVIIIGYKFSTDPVLFSVAVSLAVCVLSVLYFVILGKHMKSVAEGLD